MNLLAGAPGQVDGWNAVCRRLARYFQIGFPEPGGP